MSNKPPIEVPQGAIRLNTDSQKLEFYAQDRWYEMATDTPALNGGTRGTFHGGETPTRVDTIDYITIPTQGNAIDFGDTVSGNLRSTSSCSSNTRSVICAGEDGSTPRVVHLQFITFASTGDSTDAADLTVGTRGSASLSNQTRGITANGSTPSYPGTVDFYAIASLGNALDFGDQVTARASSGVAASPTRGIFAGGYNPGTLSSIESLQIATTGDRVNFGDLSAARNAAALGIISNTVNGYFAGGQTPSQITDINRVAIASFGNGISFGDLTVARQEAGGVSDTTRGVAAGGYPGPSANNTDTIDYFSLATGGEAADFGNLSQARFGCSGSSNGHGGL